ncbi:hypothetical protein C8Q74DRAFT_980852 [Fomes fomentarius]|nr:hypothetical protein C8Q74DRAFT_980852 [Fomes fomentarius]
MATPLPSAVSVLTVKNGITIVSYPPVTDEGVTDVGYTGGGNDGNTNPTDGTTRPTEISTTSTTPLLITSDSHDTITAISTDIAQVTEGVQTYSAPPLGVGAIVGITVAVVLFVAAMGTVVMFRCVRRGRKQRHYPMGRPEGAGKHLVWPGRRRSHNSLGQSPFMQLRPNDSLLRTQIPSASESQSASRIDSREKALSTTLRSSVNSRADLERAVISGHPRSPRSPYHATTTMHTLDSDAPPSYRRFTYNLPAYEKGNASRSEEAPIVRSKKKNRVVRPGLAVVDARPLESVDHVEDARSDTGSTPSTVPPPYSEAGV